MMVSVLFNTYLLLFILFGTYLAIPSVDVEKISIYHAMVSKTAGQQQERWSHSK